ncbi:hypothetical protein CANARDRAFT_26468 [[Candida] arabinofermentans NRRL YB-2248]|uniref:Uncharacterized protein n=1 Tax=[Candida] arabinofermentans NRRL YB-2248 TaxID=983967 RepID=A0A1E4T989_9ASCO|nr:hypothetical protein CANARDRAFT_26468 [[Candida] arabinofermentans NRRL YB-2248]
MEVKSIEVRSSSHAPNFKRNLLHARHVTYKNNSRVSTSKVSKQVSSQLGRAPQIL